MQCPPGASSASGNGSFGGSAGPGKGNGAGQGLGPGPWHGDGAGAWQGPGDGPGHGLGIGAGDGARPAESSASWASAGESTCVENGDWLGTRCWRCCTWDPGPMWGCAPIPAGLWTMARPPAGAAGLPTSSGGLQNAMSASHWQPLAVQAPWSRAARHWPGVRSATPSILRVLLESKPTSRSKPYVPASNTRSVPVHLAQK
mmetsp:Transcript_22665/g.70593  ORF Transcript_22665/g.70593 Transcript_22665/m.70593 type:complete len:201 (-) Transcript_22665:282-884(-)